jgi:hypothetical protein
MKSKVQKKKKNQKQFSANEITRPEVIEGGGKGPIIDRDKVKVPKRR